MPILDLPGIFEIGRPDHKSTPFVVLGESLVKDGKVGLPGLLHVSGTVPLDRLSGIFEISRPDHKSTPFVTLSKLASNITQRIFDVHSFYYFCQSVSHCSLVGPPDYHIYILDVNCANQWGFLFVEVDSKRRYYFCQSVSHCSLVDPPDIQYIVCDIRWVNQWGF